MRWTVASGLSSRLGHVGTRLRLPVVRIARTMIDFGCGVDPHLAGAGACGRSSGCRQSRPDGFDTAGAGVVAAGAALPVSQLCTPPWPPQAPLRVVPLKEVPSLQVAVTVAGAWASAGESEAHQRDREQKIPHETHLSLRSTSIPLIHLIVTTPIKYPACSGGSADNGVVNHQHDDRADDGDK